MHNYEVNKMGPKNHLTRSLEKIERFEEHYIHLNFSPISK